MFWRGAAEIHSGIHHPAGFAPGAPVSTTKPGGQLSNRMVLPPQSFARAVSDQPRASSAAVSRG